MLLLYIFGISAVCHLKAGSWLYILHLSTRWTMCVTDRVKATTIYISVVSSRASKCATINPTLPRQIRVLTHGFHKKKELFAWVLEWFHGYFILCVRLFWNAGEYLTFFSRKSLTSTRIFPWVTVSRISNIAEHFRVEGVANLPHLNNPAAVY